jgi:curved DNA-binding protein CbpA
MAANEAALRKDYYKLLGLERGRRYTEEELTQAYKQTLVKYLPEKVGDDERARLLTADVHVVRMSQARLILIRHTTH